jgi:hypothetical protein
MSMYRVSDYSSFEARYSSNGGAYAFFETFRVSRGGSPINGKHSTTSDFSYCPRCGKFEQRIQDHLDRCWEYVPSRLAEKTAWILFNQGFGAAEAWLKSQGDYTLERLEDPENTYLWDQVTDGGESDLLFRDRMSLDEAQECAIRIHQQYHNVWYCYERMDTTC